MAAAVRDGVLWFSFMDVPAFDRLAGLSGMTFQELSAQTGIPLELLVVVREAVGFAEPDAEETVREDELSVVSLIQLQLAERIAPFTEIGPVELRGVPGTLRLHTAHRNA
jgi:hypothetical protein